MTKPFTERDRELAHAHFFVTADRGKAVELAAAAREDVLRQFEALALDWSTDPTHQSFSGNPIGFYRKCAGDLMTLVYKLREEP